jgi:c-di-GMP-binding flagellar brake protein YcgR
MPLSKPKLAVQPPDRHKDRRRRRYARFRAEFRVTVTFLDVSRYHKIEGHSKDLSQGGMGLLLAAELKAGEVVGLNFAVPAAESWEMRAVVRHRRGYHYGFEFLSPSGKQVDALKKYLSGLELSD